MSKITRIYLDVHPKTTAYKTRSVDSHMNATESVYWQVTLKVYGFFIVKNLCTKIARNLTQKRGLEDHWPEKGSAIEAHWGGCRDNTF